MKNIDRVRLLAKELGHSLTFKEVREHISEGEIGDQQVRNILSRIKKSEISRIGNDNITNIPIICNTEENSYISYSSPISEEVREGCLKLYGEVWGRLMAYILSCYGEDILVPQEVLAYCHEYGYSALLLNKKVNIKDLAADIFNRHFEECPFNVNISGFIPDKSCRIVENFEVCEELLSLLEKPAMRLVDVFTGYPVNMSPGEVLGSNVTDIEALRTRLINQGLDYNPLLEKNFKVAFGTVAVLENIAERVKQFSILNKIRQSPQPQYSAVKKSMRLYAKGASFQVLSRETRKTFFTGMAQFDLKHAQLVIVSKLWEAPELLDYFNGSPVWSSLIAETSFTGISSSVIKATIKKGIYTLIFGGTYENAVTNMAQESGLAIWKVKQAISACKFFKLLESASNRFSETIKKTKTCKDAFGNELCISKLTAKEIRSIKGCQAQSFEVAVMIPIVNYLMDKGFNCWLLLHDGFIADSEAFRLYPELKLLTELTSSNYGMKLELTFETIE